MDKFGNYNKNKIDAYRKTPIGRASTLLSRYNRTDKLAKRGHGDLTSQWIVDNIFSQPCVHCGKEGWNIIGCNRINNDKPHTKDNVEPCCRSCNAILRGEEVKDERSKQVDQIDPTTGEIIHVWESAREAGRQLGLHQTHISKCCNGGFYSKSRNKWVNLNTYNGYMWKCPL